MTNKPRSPRRPRRRWRWNRSRATAAVLSVLAFLGIGAAIGARSDSNVAATNGAPAFGGMLPADEPWIWDDDGDGGSVLVPGDPTVRQPDTSTHGS